ncbi:uncharacterized protein LOC123977556 [Micropterus dolomieu]|uniref:uncharacterized protein LOC123977556 n=1 Tax=Micropterus dolomieu TaxID=147949 RepID=UPI001E8E9633|nr:uncharacterized protein LOC123977556 [Micropterus dolomieu]
MSPDKVYTIVLDMELPEFQPQDSKHRENVGASSPDVSRCSQGAELCDVTLIEVSSIESPEKKAGVFKTLIALESDETNLKINYLKSHALKESQVADSLPENPLVVLRTELEEVNSTIAKKLSCKGNLETHNEVSNSSKSCGSVAECELIGANAAETTFPDGKQEEMTDFCHTEEQTMSSGLCTVEGDALTEKQIPAGDKQVTVADTAQDTGTANLEMAEEENMEEESEPEHPESKLSKVPDRRDKVTLPFEESELKVPASLDDTEVTQGQVLQLPPTIQRKTCRLG